MELTEVWASALCTFILGSCGNNQPNKKSTGSLFIPSLLEQESQPRSLAFRRDSKAGRGMGKLNSKKKRKVPGVPD